jgi:hypothetical protein
MCVLVGCGGHERGQGGKRVLLMSGAVESRGLL